MKRSVAALIVAVAVIAVIGWKPAPSTQRVGACRPSTDDGMVSLLAEAKHMVASPKSERMRAILHLPAMDSSLVRPIQVDSVCLKAVKTINRDRGGIDSSRAIYLVRIGQVYWAEDPLIRGGEYMQTFIMDSSLTTILSRTLR